MIDPGSSVVKCEIESYCKLHSLPSDITLFVWKSSVFDAADLCTFFDLPFSEVLHFADFYAFANSPKLQLYLYEGKILTRSAIKNRRSRGTLASDPIRIV